MKNYVSLILLSLGVLCITLALTFDLMAWTTVREKFRRDFRKTFPAQCPPEHHHSGRSPRGTRRRLSFPPWLTGLRLTLFLHPFELQGGTGGMASLTFKEVGALALQVEVVEGSVWVRQEPQRSTMALDQPFLNVNLLDVVMVELLQGIVPEAILEVLIPLPEGSSLVNMSVLQRIANALENLNSMNKSDPLQQSLRKIHQFLSHGANYALVYNNSAFSIRDRNEPSLLAVGSGLPALISHSRYYRLPGFRDLSWEYWRTGNSPMGGLRVDQFHVKNVWNRTLVCHFSNDYLLTTMDTFERYQVSLAPPGTTDHPLVNSTVSATPGKGAVLDVYRPLGVPAGGLLAAQINLRVPNQTEFGTLKGLTAPLMWLNVTVEALPEEVLALLEAAITTRTVAVLVLGVGGGSLLLLVLLANLALPSLPRHPRKHTRHPL